MKKLLLTLTAGLITFGAASTAARADWNNRGPAYITRAPVQVYVAPAYRPVVYAPPVYAPLPYAPPVYVAPAYSDYWRHAAWERWHHWHGWAEQHAVW